MRTLAGIWLGLALWLGAIAYGFAQGSPESARPPEVYQAEARKIEAERFKLELEAKEIGRRLNAPWWQGQNLTQYLLAVVITAALLFGWTRVYLEPILRKEGELNRKEGELNSIRNELLKAQNEKVRKEQKEAIEERDRQERAAKQLAKEQKEAIEERDRLEQTAKQLTKERQTLTSQVAGLNIAVDQALQGKGTFFSILNSQDPINELARSYGWKVSSDDWGGFYYLVIQHPDVRSGTRILVNRFFEIDEIKKKKPADWRHEIEKIIARHAAAGMLALDYSYFALLVETQASVGGVIYGPGAAEIKFDAPLAEWSEKLAALFPNT
jgi:hypothetical protein